MFHLRSSVPSPNLLFIFLLKKRYVPSLLSLGTSTFRKKRRRHSHGSTSVATNKECLIKSHIKRQIIDNFADLMHFLKCSQLYIIPFPFSYSEPISDESIRWMLPLLHRRPLRQTKLRRGHSDEDSPSSVSIPFHVHETYTSAIFKQCPRILPLINIKHYMLACC